MNVLERLHANAWNIRRRNWQMIFKSACVTATKSLGRVALEYEGGN